MNCSRNAVFSPREQTHWTDSLVRHAVGAFAVVCVAFFTQPALAVDTKWIFNGDGNWTEAVKWSAGEPDDTPFDVLIDEGDAAVTVTLNLTRSVGSVTLGQDDTLVFENTLGTVRTLTSVDDFTNDGSLFLTGTGNGNTALAVTNGTLINSETGLVHFQTGGNGVRILTGNLQNDGTVLVDRATTFNKTGGSYINNNQITVAAGASLSIDNGGTLEQAAGTLDLDGALTFVGGGSTVKLTGGTLDLNSTMSLATGVFTQNGGAFAYTSGGITNGTFNYLGGTITGVPQLSTATLNIGPAATNPVSFLLQQNNDLAGNVHAGQTLTVQNTTTGLRTLSSATGFTNGGSIVLTGTNSGPAELVLVSGTLTNSATGILQFQPGGTGVRRLDGHLANNGTVLVDRITTFEKTAGIYVNNNQFTVAAGATLTIDNGGVLRQSAGRLDLDGALTLLGGGNAIELTGGVLDMSNTINLGQDVLTQTGGTFAFTSGALTNGRYNYLGGTISGVPQLSGVTLNLGTTNPVSFLLQQNNTLASNVHPGQILTVQNTTASQRTLTSATGFNNNGSILLTGTNAGHTALAVTTGTLTNTATGMVHFQPGGSGIRLFTGDLINDGTVLVDRSTTFFGAGGSYINNNQFNVAAGATLTIDSGGTFQQAAGALTLNGTFNLISGSTLDLKDGTLTVSASTTIGTGGTLAFSGGRLQLEADFNLPATRPITLNAAGGTINTNSFKSTISGVISGAGGLTKIGPGTLTLAGANTYAGATTVNAGTLVVTGSLVPTGNVALKPGVTLAGAGNGTTTGRVGNVLMEAGSHLHPGATADDDSVGKLSVSNLGVSGGDIRFDLQSPDTNDQIAVTGVANFAAPSTISLTGLISGGATTHTVALITAGVLSGTVPTLVVPPVTRPTFTLDFDTAADQIRLTIDGTPKGLNWTGANSSAWDLDTTANWADGVVAEKFFNLDSVTFHDGPANRNVVLNVTAVPDWVLVNNSAGNDYTITGTGGIGDTGFAGGTTLTKNGAGSLTLGGANTYKGMTTVGGGLLSITGSIASSNAVTVAAPAAFAVEGSATVRDITGTGTTTVGNGRATATLTTNFIRQESLSIDVGGLVKLNPDSGPSVVGALSIAITPGAAPGKLDVTNNAVIVDYPSAGPSPEATIRARIIAGRGGTGLGKTWNGPGITSSTAAANPVNSTSVGYAVNGSLPLAPYITFAGHPVDATTVLMRTTRTGDANLDGVVNNDDVTVVGANYAPGFAKPFWALGDFDYNGFVDNDDVTLLGVYYNPNATPIPPPDAALTHIAAVPEPETLVILIVGLLLMIRPTLRTRNRAKSNVARPARCCL